VLAMLRGAQMSIGATRSGPKARCAVPYRRLLTRPACPGAAALLRTNRSLLGIGVATPRLIAPARSPADERSDYQLLPSSYASFEEAYVGVQGGSTVGNRIASEGPGRIPSPPRMGCERAGIREVAGPDRIEHLRAGQRCFRRDLRAPQAPAPSPAARCRGSPDPARGAGVWPRARNCRHDTNAMAADAVLCGIPADRLGHPTACTAPPIRGCNRTRLHLCAPAAIAIADRAA
jgi:hypothetical protein